MDSLLLRCSSSTLAQISSCSSSPLISSSRNVSLRTRVIVAASDKANNNKNRNKEDKHSFVARPDESIGPFPEAVLLKQKKVREDGRLLPDFADAEEEALYEALSLQLESDLNIERMRHYEIVYLIHEDRKEEVESVNEKIEEFIKEKKGKLWRFSDWGMRRLAYPIQKAKNAHYILMNFEMEAKWINEFKTMLDQDERVIRHLVIKRDKAETEECPPPPEFHTLRAANEEEDGFDNAEDYDEAWEDDNNEEGEEAEANGIIYVEDEDEDEDEDDNGGRESRGGRKQEMELAR